MTKVALSEFKARMSYFIRLVKSGEPVELEDRGVPVACVSAIEHATEELLIAPQASAKALSSMKFSQSLPKEQVDVVEMLLIDRGRR